MLNKDDIKDILKMLSMVSQLGLIMVASIGIGFFIGRFIDRILNLTFIFTAIFIILGVLAGFWNIYKSIYSIFDKE
ncbi:AtpZ/AtpI family protein [Selenihalanaerobacter shriftii]|uniref:AtpZ/AtpI family protein n=1 Tax=Selenihalanaerobacter shriftii TaxID=142842 RepID=UPI0009999B19|nr:AtpZ/AtpI family protein [Selenihalanaerobacter shriftii]